MLRPPRSINLKEETHRGQETDHDHRRAGVPVADNQNAETARLMGYYWDTIAACVPPETILDGLTRTGFQDVRRHTQLGIFSEYLGSKPG